jgi:N-alpha-acetyl-L-2,4-diaminobutyrate deacetylase
MHVRDFDPLAFPLATKTQLILDVGSVRCSSAKLHLTVIRGNQSGKTVLALAGVHGDEFEGPFALWRILEELQPEEMSGTTLILPVANWAAFEAGQRCSPADSANLNRCFPGHPTGSFTEVLAHDIFERLVGVSDMVIDLHSGGAISTFYPTVCYLRESPRSALSLAACCSFGLDLIWSLPSAHGVMTNEAARAGKIAVGAEYGGGARLDPAGIEAYVQGVRSCLEFLGNLPGGSPRKHDAPIVEGDFLIAQTNFGRLHLEVQPGDAIRADQLLATITDFERNCSEELVAPQDGLVLGVRPRPVIQRGDWVVCPVHSCRADALPKDHCKP